MSSSSALLDATGRRRSPAAMPGHNAGRPPRNKGVRYPADPPTVEEIVAVMRKIPVDRHGLRLRAMIVVLWRGGLRIQEALGPLFCVIDGATRGRPPAASPERRSPTSRLDPIQGRHRR
jgi:integrase